METDRVCRSEFLKTREEADDSVVPLPSANTASTNPFTGKITMRFASSAGKRALKKL